MFPVSLAWKYTCECVGCWVISWLFATWKSLRRGDMEQLNWILAGNLRKQMDFSYIWQQISYFPVAQKICCCQLLFDNLNISPWSEGLACALLDCLFWWVCPADSILSVLSKAQLWWLANPSTPKRLPSRRPSCPAYRAMPAPRARGSYQRSIPCP